jgi:hypothetical protein
MLGYNAIRSTTVKGDRKRIEEICEKYDFYYFDVEWDDEGNFSLSGDLVDGEDDDEDLTDADEDEDEIRREDDQDESDSDDDDEDDSVDLDEVFTSGFPLAVKRNQRSNGAKKKFEDQGTIGFVNFLQELAGVLETPMMILAMKWDPEVEYYGCETWSVLPGASLPDRIWEEHGNFLSHCLSMRSDLLAKRCKLPDYSQA